MAGIIKKKLIRPLRDFIVYCFIKFLFFITKLFPRKLILFWHGYLAVLVFRFFVNTRKNILTHLKLVFGKEKSDAEIKKMGEDVFRNLGKTFTDYIYLSNLTTREEFLKYFTIEGEEHLKAAYEKGNGVLCLIPHTPGWEFSAIMPPVLGYETSAVSREIKNAALNKTMIRLRQKRGMKNISRKKCYDALVDVLKKGECLIIMIDQDSKKIRGEFLNFFGMKAYTPLGCARLAIETGAAVVPMATFRKPDNTYLFKICAEIPLEKTGDFQTDVLLNTQKHNDAMEAFIREYPTQWVWMHKRWHTTPDNLKKYWDKKKKKHEN